MLTAKNMRMCRNIEDHAGRNPSIVVTMGSQCFRNNKNRTFLPIWRGGFLGNDGMLTTENLCKKITTPGRPNVMKNTVP